MRTSQTLGPLTLVALLIFTSSAHPDSADSSLQLTPQDALETHGLSIFLFHNSYHPVFGDQKSSGLEIIFHDQRIATNGDVRLSPTPAQWDPIPQFKDRQHGTGANELVAALAYPEREFAYRINVRPEEGGLRVAVMLDRTLPQHLAGKAGFNLEFLPTAYFGKSYIMDESAGLFPRHPAGPMTKQTDGAFEPSALAQGRSIVLSPEDPLTRVRIECENNPLMLFDGRDLAPNGWFVVRTLIPSDKTGEVVVWHIRVQPVPGWFRKAVIGYNQVGYTPDGSKIAVLELDPNQPPSATARLLRLDPDGSYKEAFSGQVHPWGKWLRYQYAHFDFSAVRKPGTYVIEYAGVRAAPFRISPNVYDGIWHNALDTYLAQQMDHVKVRETYRIWHGASHLDDARQAPVNYTHFDGYAQGPTTDSPFAPGQHIPGLDVGGWFDAGDFDLRTQTHSRVITDLVLARENFGLDWDDTTVDETARYVQIRKPDGVPDSIQQIVHGTLYLLAQYKIFGHAIPGVIDPILEQYTHLGDAASDTDGKIYSDNMSLLQSDGIYSGVPDDRWAFTTHTTPLNYDAASALAAASRTLRGFNDKMADTCLQTAESVWQQEHNQPPALFHSFNTTGGDLRSEEIQLAVELLIATKGKEIYRQRLTELRPTIQELFPHEGATAVRAIPYMNPEFRDSLRSMLVTYKTKLDANLAKNPYGVPISMGGWGGAGQVLDFAAQMYFFHQAFPDVIGADYTFRALDYLLGAHPASNVSYVSGIGAQSKLIAYGNNRPDYTFIPGGVIPGVTVIQPDFPELMNDWPFLWYENEYVVDAASSFIFVANAANTLAKDASARH